MPPVAQPTKAGIKWHEVTWYSKLGAIILLLGVVPALCFYIGTQYESVLAQPLMTIAPTIAKSATPDLHYYVDPAIESTFNICDANASSTPDELDCVGSSIQAYQKELDAKFAMVLKSLDESATQNPDLVYYSSQREKINYFQDEKEQLQTAQTAWSSYANATCAAAQDEWTDGSGYVIGYGLCELDLIKSRIYQLCEPTNDPTQSRCDSGFSY